jgi:hypothetical protein
MSYSLEQLGSYVPALWLLCGTTLLAIIIFMTLGNYRSGATRA